MKTFTIVSKVMLALVISSSLTQASTRLLHVIDENSHSVHVQANTSDGDPHPQRSIDLDGAPSSNEQTPAPTDGRSRLWNDTLTPPSDPGPDIVQDPIRFHIAMMEWLAYRIAVRQTQR